MSHYGDKTDLTQYTRVGFQAQLEASLEAGSGLLAVTRSLRRLCGTHAAASLKGSVMSAPHSAGNHSVLMYDVVASSIAWDSVVTLLPSTGATELTSMGRF